MKERILTCLPLLPMVLHWILPYQMESRFYLSLFDLPFFIPNICYFIYIANYKWLNTGISEYIGRNIKYCVKTICALLFIYTLYNALINKVDGVFLLLINNQTFLFYALLFLLYPMNNKMIENTKYIVIPTAIILNFEVIVFSLGILRYSLDLGETEYGGLTRISTTIGAATGSAIILTMLGVIMVACYNINSKLKIVLGTLTTIGIFLTISRGSILVWILFLGIYFYQNYYRKRCFLHKLRTIAIIISAVFVLNYFGVFNPVVERQNQLDNVGNVMTGRDYLQDKALNVYHSSNGIGVGIGQVNLEKSLEGVVEQSNPVGVHNFYYATLAELGIPGILLIAGLLIYLLFHFDYKRSVAAYTAILILVTFNTEPVFSYAEFAAPVFFLIMLSLKRSHRRYYIVPRNEVISRSSNFVCG